PWSTKRRTPASGFPGASAGAGGAPRASAAMPASRNRRTTSGTRPRTIAAKLEKATGRDHRERAIAKNAVEIAEKPVLGDHAEVAEGPPPQLAHDRVHQPLLV